MKKLLSAGSVNIDKSVILHARGIHLLWLSTTAYLPTGQKSNSISSTLDKTPSCHCQGRVEGDKRGRGQIEGWQNYADVCESEARPCHQIGHEWQRVWWWRGNALVPGLTWCGGTGWSCTCCERHFITWAFTNQIASFFFLSWCSLSVRVCATSHPWITWDFLPFALPSYKVIFDVCEWTKLTGLSTRLVSISKYLLRP